MTRSPLLLALMAVGALHGAAAAQTRSAVHFPAGASEATVSGHVKGHDYVDYTLGARAGQTLTAALKVTGGDGNGTVYFNLLPPGSDDVGIFNGSTSPDGKGTVKLPATGDYVVRVYLMGNDKDAGKTVNYALTVAIH